MKSYSFLVEVWDESVVEVRDIQAALSDRFSKVVVASLGQINMINDEQEDE